MTAPLSHKPQSEYQNFYFQIERHWSWRRGSQIILSPLEFETVERWYSADIPLPVILRAIDLYVERRAKRASNKPYYLSHLDKTLDKVRREYEMLHQGEHDGSEGSDLAESKLEQLDKRLRKVRPNLPEPAQASLDEVVGQLKAIEPQSIVDIDEIESRFAALNRQLAQASLQALPADQREALQVEASEIVTPEEDAGFYAKVLDDIVRSHLGLPRLTLLA